MSSVSFTVNGIPQPRGSKKALPNRATGRAMMVDSNAKSGPWMNAVAHEAAKAMGGADLIQGPLRVSIVFNLPRPKSHFYSTKARKGELRDDAPHFHSGRPDCDKLIRGVGDGMTGVVYVDDGQIAELHVGKHYASSGGSCDVLVEKI